MKNHCIFTLSSCRQCSTQGMVMSEFYRGKIISSSFVVLVSMFKEEFRIVRERIQNNNIKRCCFVRKCWKGWHFSVQRGKKMKSIMTEVYKVMKDLDQLFSNRIGSILLKYQEFYLNKCNGILDTVGMNCSLLLQYTKKAGSILNLKKKKLDQTIQWTTSP